MLSTMTNLQFFRAGEDTYGLRTGLIGEQVILSNIVDDTPEKITVVDTRSDDVALNRSPLTVKRFMLVVINADVQYREAMREDVHYLGPTVLRQNTLFLTGKMQKYSSRVKREIDRYHDTIEVPNIDDESQELLALDLFTSGQLASECLVVVDGRYMVDWVQLNSLLFTNVHNYRNAPLGVCLKNESADVSCGGFVMSMESAEALLEKERLLKEKLGENYTFHVPSTKVSLSLATGMIDSSNHLFKIMAERDPKVSKYIGIKFIDLDSSEQYNSVNELFSVVTPTAKPQWIVAPRKRPCDSRKGVYVFETGTSSEAAMRRKLYRNIMKGAGLENDAYFLVGKNSFEDYLAMHEENEIYDDILMYDHPDTYKYLTYKGFAMLSFFNEYCPLAEAVIKMDLDVLMDFTMLIDENHEFVSDMKPVTCLFSIFYNNPVTRNNLATSNYSASYRIWPFDTHPKHCSGPAYLLKRSATEKLYDAMLNRSWYGPEWSYQDSCMTNEDSILTGRFRVLAGLSGDDVMMHNTNAKHHNKKKFPEFSKLVSEYAPYKKFRDMLIPEDMS